MIGWEKDVFTEDDLNQSQNNLSEFTVSQSEKSEGQGTNTFSALQIKKQPNLISTDPQPAPAKEFNILDILKKIENAKSQHQFLLNKKKAQV